MKNENTFVKLYGQILLEMPYLFNLSRAKVPNSGEHFDMELEKYPNKQALSEHLYKLFKGGIFTDKYGNTIHITNWQESQNLFIRMLKDIEVLKYIKAIIKAGTISMAKKWLVDIKKTSDRVVYVHEGMKFRKKFKIYVMYKSDGSSQLKGRVNAYSDRQAVAYFLKLTPEYNNDRLFYVYAEEDAPVMRLPYRDD